MDTEQARDTRPVVRPAQVLAAVVAMAEASRVPLAPANMGGTTPPRWSSPPQWPGLRSAFHVLPDPVRRECIVRLLLEEADQRVAHDEAASLNHRGATTKRRGEE
jgi:hypothetical protein